MSLPTVIVLASGRGERFAASGGTTPKLKARLAAKTVLLPLAPIGVWVGVRLARRISAQWFYRFLYLGMFLTGVKLLRDGLP